jgi:phosphonate transport system substrate-binding protein
MTRPFLFLAVVFFACLLSFGSVVAQQPAQLDLTFGLYLTDKATTMFAKFKPIVDHLESDLPKRLHRPVKITFKFSKTYDAAILALVQGDVDFVRFGPASYIIAKNRNSKLSLLAMELRGGKKRFNGVLIVAKDSPIKSIDQLRNKRFAFGDRNSTIGRYLAQDLLLKSGINAHELGGFSFLGRHDRVAKAVELGDYDVGSVKISTFKKMNKAGKLRILASFENVTKPWIARAGLDPEVVKALSASLHSIREKSLLKTLKVSGLQPAQDHDFGFVRAAMKRALAFEKK